MAKKAPPIETRFKPGVSGNPGGKPKLPPDLKAVSELTVDELKRTIAKYGRMTKAEVAAAIQNPQTPMIELNIATIFATGTKTGDYARLAFLLDRSIGKPAQDVSFAGTSEPIAIAYVPKSQREKAS